MSQLVMPDSACRGIDIEGAWTGATTRYSGPVVTVDNPQHAKALRELGAFPANLGGRTSGGYVCGCGFRTYFRTCSRCGGEATRQP